ncbi:CAP family protein [Flavobacteriaceae bacterium]|nr:CAP family protein [Flavobacteriaceae bacterium]
MKKLLLLCALIFSFYSFGQRTDNEKALKIHNLERASLGLNGLEWSNKLERDAQKYADYLAKKEKFRHSNQLDKLNQGENLFKLEGDFTLKDYLSEASFSWLSEKKDYVYAKIGDNKNIFSKVGHYTQMIWHNTTKIGIAYSKSKLGNVYVVARYYPSGNWDGEYPY